MGTGQERAGSSGPRARRKRRNHVSRHLRRRAAGDEGVWWAPHRAAWWTAVLFAIGSACFAVASLPGAAEAVPPEVVGVVYFVGSIFFTAAGYTQYLEVVNADRLAGAPAPMRWFGWQPAEIGFWAATIQSVGTVCFNVSTFWALDRVLTTRQEDLLVWSPDAVGSVCFLVASGLAVREVGGGGRPWWSPRSLGWDVAWLNMVGSIAFGFSAVAAFVVPDTGDLRNAALATSGTLLGALCFLAGAILLMPEAAREEDREWVAGRSPS